MIIYELLLNGLVEGSLLALICIGYTIAYGVAKVLNFAHADVLIAGGGYLVLFWLLDYESSLTAKIGMSLLFSISTLIVFWPYNSNISNVEYKNYLLPFISSILVFLLVFYLCGSLTFFWASIFAIPLTGILATGVYRVGYQPLIKKNAPRTSVLLAALGFSIGLESILLITWGSIRRVFPISNLPRWFIVRQRPAGTSFLDSILDYGVIPITSQILMPIYDLFIVVTFILIAIILGYFFKYSRFADAIVASADSRFAARSCGIPVNKILASAFFIGGLIASIGGTLYVLRAKSLYPTAGFSLGIIAFVACVLGGIGSIRGSILGAFLVSIVISLAPAIPLSEFAINFIPSEIIHWLPSLSLSDWSYGVVYVLMIITILFKPRGLFAK